MPPLNADDHFMPYWEVLNRESAGRPLWSGDSADVSGTYLAAESRLNIARGLDEAVRPSACRLRANTNGRNALARRRGAGARHRRRHRSATRGKRDQYRRASDAASNFAQLCVIDDSYNANPGIHSRRPAGAAQRTRQAYSVLGDIMSSASTATALHLSLLQDIEAHERRSCVDARRRMQRAATAMEVAPVHILNLDAMMQALADEIAQRGTGSVTVLAKGRTRWRCTASLNGSMPVWRKTMLLWLANLFATDIRALSAFNYITLRSVLACHGDGHRAGDRPRMIRWLLTMKIGQAVRDDGPHRTGQAGNADDGRRSGADLHRGGDGALG